MFEPYTNTISSKLNNDSNNYFQLFYKIKHDNMLLEKYLSTILFKYIIIIELCLEFIIRTIV